MERETYTGVPSRDPVEEPASGASSGAPAAGSPHQRPADGAQASTPAPSAPAGDQEAPHGDPLTRPEGSPDASAEATETPASATTEHGDGAEAAPEEEAGQAHEQQVERDLEELTARAEKAEEYLVLAQRTKADFENFRKRASREAGLAQDRGVAKLAKELLPAIDNLDRAVQAASAFASGSPEEAAAEAESQLASGIKLVHADVLAALARVGIEPFSPAGEPFDPQYHEAVAQHPVEGQAPGTVIEVFQHGYRLGETVLRPARVLVAA